MGMYDRRPDDDRSAMGSDTVHPARSAAAGDDDASGSGSSPYIRRAPFERRLPPGPLPAARVAQIQNRIRTGFYDADTVLMEVARRMLNRGDI